MLRYETIFFIILKKKCCVKIIIDGLNIKYNLDSINIHVYIYSLCGKLSWGQLNVKFLWFFIL